MLSIPPRGIRLFIHVGHLSPGRSIPAILETFAAPALTAHVVFLGGGRFEPLVARVRGQARQHSPAARRAAGRGGEPGGRV